MTGARTVSPGTDRAHRGYRSALLTTRRAIDLKRAASALCRHGVEADSHLVPA